MQDLSFDPFSSESDCRNRETILPIYWEEWDEIDSMSIQFSNVEFYDNWGPFKVGDCVDHVSLNIADGVVTVYNNNNEVKIPVVLCPKEEGV